jgi:hypothetical protein
MLQVGFKVGSFVIQFACSVEGDRPLKDGVFLKDSIFLVKIDGC